MKDFLTEAKAAGRSEPVTLPGMKRKAFARTLSAAAMRRITEASTVAGKSPTDAEAFDNDRLVALLIGAAVVDEKGERLIPEGREAEIEEMPNAIKVAMQTAVLRVNGMSGETLGND